MDFNAVASDPAGNDRVYVVFTSPPFKQPPMFCFTPSNCDIDSFLYMHKFFNFEELGLVTEHICHSHCLCKQAMVIICHHAVLWWKEVIGPNSCTFFLFSNKFSPLLISSPLLEIHIYQCLQTEKVDYPNKFRMTVYSSTSSADKLHEYWSWFNFFNFIFYYILRDCKSILILVKNSFKRGFPEKIVFFFNPTSKDPSKECGLHRPNCHVLWISLSGSQHAVQPQKVFALPCGLFMATAGFTICVQSKNRPNGALNANARIWWSYTPSGKIAMLLFCLPLFSFTVRECHLFPTFQPLPFFLLVRQRSQVFEHSTAPSRLSFLPPPSLSSHFPWILNSLWECLSSYRYLLLVQSDVLLKARGLSPDCDRQSPG